MAKPLNLATLLHLTLNLNSMFIQIDHRCHTVYTLKFTVYSLYPLIKTILCEIQGKIWFAALKSRYNPCLPKNWLCTQTEYLVVNANCGKLRLT